MAIGKMLISPDTHGKLGEGASDDLGRQFRDALRGGRLLYGWVALKQRPR
jgi:hypothetical protein